MSVRQRRMMYFLEFTHTLMLTDLLLLVLGSWQSSVGLSTILSLIGTRRTD